MLEGISIDELPPGWRNVPLGSFCEFSGGTQPPKSKFKSSQTNGYVRLLQIRDFETDKHAVYVPFNKRLRVIKSDDISIGRYGASVGRILTGKSGAINVAIMTTFPDESQVTKPFLRFALCLNDFQNYLTGLGGRAAQAGFNQGEISRFKFPLPLITEQRKIAGILELVQRAIEQQELLIMKTAELKKTLLHQLFTKGLRVEPQKQTEIGPVPESWEVRTIGEIAKTRTGGTPARDNIKYWENGTIPWVKTGEINFGVINSTNEKITDDGLTRSAAKIFPKGTLLVAMYGQGITRGRVGILGIEAATNQACAAIIPHSEAQVSSLFLFYFIEYHYENIRKLGHGANQKNMNAALVRGFPIAFPKADEQKETINILSRVDAKLLLFNRKQNLLSALFRTLLRQLMTGTKRVDALPLNKIIDSGCDS
jgi:type I restriction enzyme S subunit